MGGVGIPTIIPEQEPDTEVTNSGGLINSNDGKPSTRKVWGGICFIAAILSAVVGIFRLPVDRALVWADLIYFLPVPLFLVAGLYLLKMLTNQAIQGILSATKKD